MMDQMDWSPVRSDEFVKRLDGFVNRAYQRLFSEAPELFRRDFFMEVYPDVKADSGNTTDRIQPTSGIGAHSCVLTRSNLTAAGNARWEFDGTWNGRLLEVTRPNGVVLRRRVMDMWRVPMTGGLGGFTEYVSIDEPWPNDTDEGMEYRFFWDTYPLPVDLLDIQQASIWHDTSALDLMVIAPGTMHSRMVMDKTATSGGTPVCVSKGEQENLRAPATPPAVATGSDTWDGPEAPGTFEVCYTLCWGKTETVTSGGFGTPRWESSPSTVMGCEATDYSDPSIEIQTPDIDYSLGFKSDSSLGNIGDGHSGFYKRLYARRLSVTPSTAIRPGKTPIASPELMGDFYLIAEIEGDETAYQWTGARIDLTERMSYQRMYRGIRLWPRPDRRYSLRLRGTVKPTRLVDGVEAPILEDTAREALICCAMTYFYSSDGKQEIAELMEARYIKYLATARLSARTIKPNTTLGLPSRRAVTPARMPMMRRFIGQETE